MTSSHSRCLLSVGVIAGVSNTELSVATPSTPATGVSVIATSCGSGNSSGKDDLFSEEKILKLLQPDDRLVQIEIAERQQKLEEAKTDLELKRKRTEQQLDHEERRLKLEEDRVKQQAAQTQLMLAALQQGGHK